MVGLRLYLQLLFYLSSSTLTFAQSTPACDVTHPSNKQLEARCRRNSSSTVCSRHGSCVCGMCQCDRVGIGELRYEGQFCECNNYDCPYSNGKPCGGETRGKCQCSQCVCTKGYKGEVCDCPTSNEGCIASNGIECNGYGHCECGRCRCNKDAYYRGRTCEDCPTCPGRCEKIKACVQCNMFRSGPLSREHCRKKCTYVRVVAILQVTEQKRLCRFQDDDGCMFRFAYYSDSNIVEAEHTKQCAVPSTEYPADDAAMVTSSLIAIVTVTVMVYFLH